MKRTKLEHPEIRYIFCENAQQFAVFEIIPKKQKQKGAHSEYFDKINRMSTDESEALTGELNMQLGTTRQLYASCMIYQCWAITRSKNHV